MWIDRLLTQTSYRALMAAEGTGSAAADGTPSATAPAPAATSSPSATTAEASSSSAPATSDTSAPAGAAAAASPASGSPSPAAPEATSAAGADPAAAATAPTTESTPSLLESASGKPKADAPAATPDKPAPTEAKPADGEKPPEAKAEVDPGTKDATAEAQPPAPKTYEPFKAPEGVQLGEKELKAFTDIIGPAQVPQEVAQNLVDLYVTETNRVRDLAAQHQRDVWNGFNDTWKTELKTDSELGGNRLETSLAIAKAVVEMYLPDANQQKRYWDHLRANGMGNFVEHVRLLHNIGQALNVFENSIVPAQGAMPNVPRTRADRWYGRGNGAAAP
jgi:hypothetical protein